MEFFFFTSSSDQSSSPSQEGICSINCGSELTPTANCDFTGVCTTSCQSDLNSTASLDIQAQISISCDSNVVSSGDFYTYGNASISCNSNITSNGDLHLGGNVSISCNSNVDGTSVCDYREEITITGTSNLTATGQIIGIPVEPPEPIPEEPYKQEHGGGTSELNNLGYFYSFSKYPNLKKVKITFTFDKKEYSQEEEIDKNIAIELKDIKFIASDKHPKIILKNPLIPINKI